MLNYINNFNANDTFKDFFNKEIVERINKVHVTPEVKPTPAQIDCPSVTYEYDCEYKSKKPSDVGLLHRIEDQINRQTLMSGSTINWDKQRLIDGKLAKLHEIGGAPVLLETQSNSKISSMYFSVERFFDKIEEMGGKTAELKLHLDHPFIEIAQPAVLNIKASDGSTVDSLNSAFIPYSPSMEKAFFNQTNFLDFCYRMKLTPIWEDTLEPVKLNTGWSWFSRQQNILIVSYYSYKKLENSKKDPEKNIQIAKSDNFEGAVSIFSNKFKANVIKFDGSKDIQKIKSLLTDLKINKTPMEMVEMNGNVFLINKSDAKLSAIVDLTDERKLTNNPIFSYAMHPLPKPDFGTSGAVVLSMNQTNSFTQYSHEILTFLLKGINVLAYDNAGKGLSTGENSENGLKEAVEICGEYLIQKQGFSENQIMFKGQCAGGLPSSEAAKTFPQSHIWIDQSPRNFSGVASDIYTGVIKDKIEENKGDFFKHKFFSFLDDASMLINPVVVATSKLILPKFDVVENLSLNKGSQIYTIGVSDAGGQGGDMLVPENHKKELEAYMSKNQKGHYLPMPGATHVTDWWLDSATHAVASTVLADTKLSQEIFLSKQMKSDEELIDNYYQCLTGHPFDHSVDHEVSTNIEDIQYDILFNVAAKNLDKIMLDFEYLEESYSHKSLKSTFKAGLEIAKEKEDKEMTLFFLNKLCA